jgi:RNA polymerase sigma-70 factor (ECF subfamily)
MGATLDELEAIYRERLPEFRRVASAMVGDADGGRDAVQEAFATAVRRRAQFRRKAPLEAWMWRIVISHAHDESRRPPARAVTRPEATIDGHVEGDAHVAAAIATLTARQRLVLFLRYYADLDYAAIADALEISPGTVAATLNAIHKALRRNLEEVHQ